MGSDWAIRRLGDITVNYDRIRVPVKQKDRVAGRYPYYGASGVVDHVDGYLFDGVHLLVAEDGENLRSRQKPIAFLADGKFWVNNHAHILRGNDLADTRFLMYALTTMDLTGYISGSTRPKLTQSSLKSIELACPSIKEQRRIANILGTLDDKIELNRRMNQTLEKMAAALFKSWFIDFDLVHAKAEGRDPPPLPLGEGRGERAAGLPADIANLFPDTFQNSELGPIPMGWTVGNLANIASNPRRTVKPSEIPPDTPYIGLQDMPRRSIALETWGRAESVSSGKSQFNEGEVLFGKLRPYFHKVGIAPIDGVCSTDVLVVVPKSFEWRGYVLSLVSSKPFVDHTTSCSAGTKMPRTNWKDMGRYSVALPPADLISEFESRIRRMHERIRGGIHENIRLAKLRDTFLTELLSGRFDIQVSVDK